MFSRWHWKARQARAFARLLRPHKRTSLYALHRIQALRAIREKPHVFDKDFIKDLISRLNDLDKSHWSIWIVSLIITAFLSSNLIGVTEVSLFGLSVRSPLGIREPLLCTLGVLGILLNMQSIQIDRLVAVLDAYAQYYVGLGDAKLYRLKFARLLPDQLPFPDTQKIIFNNKIFLTAQFLFLLLLLLFVLCIIFAISIVGFLNVYDLYLHPSANIWLSRFAIGFYLVSWLLSCLILLINKFPWRYRDLSILDELERLRNTDEIEYNKRIRLLSHRAFLAAKIPSPYRDFDR